MVPPSRAAYRFHTAIKKAAMSNRLFSSPYGYPIPPELASLPFITDLHPTGSRYICDPPVIDTDSDWMVLHESGKEQQVEAAMLAAGWKLPPRVGGEGNEYASHVIVFRLGELNAIVTDHPRTFKLRVFCTELAKKLNLKTKRERYDLFVGICDELEEINQTID